MTTKAFPLKPAAIILFALWLTIYFLGLGQTAVTDPNEGYYVEAAREMVENGNWLVPHLNYQIYFSKPILTFWLIALPYKLFGISEFSARIAFSLLALLLFIGVMFLGRRLAGMRCGLLAAAICATAPLMMAASRISPIDIALTCFLSLAVFAWILNYIFNDRRFWPYFYLFMALAVLIKGPAILLFVLIGLGVFLFVDFFVSKKKSIPSLIANLVQGPVLRQSILGCLIFLIIALPWYIAVSFATDGLFLKVFFLYENLARFAGYTNFTDSTWYNYFRVLAYSFVPWILFLIPATKFIFVQYFERMENQTMRALACLYCYALVLFLVLSCSGTQMDTYLLPAIPMLSIVVAFYLNDACLAISSPEPQFRAINLISNMLAIFAGILLLSLPIFMISPIVPALKTPFSLIIFIVAAGYLIQYWLKKKNKLIAMLTMFCGTTAFACILIFHVICHFVDQAGQKDLKDLCLPYKKTENQLCIFHAFKPSVLFYTERPVDSFFYPGELIVQSAQDKANMGADASKLLLFTSDQYIPLLQSLPHLSLKLLAHRGNWQVFLVENAHLMKHLTLEEMFRQTSVISNIFKQQGNWGPLTVPYTAGDRR